MENDLEELKELFLQKKASAILTVAWVDKKAKSDLSELKRNHVKNIVTFLAAAVLVVFIDRINAERMETSLSGLFLLIGCALYYAASKSFLLYRLNRIKFTNAVRQVLQQLERYKKLNVFMHTVGEMIYALVLSVGVYLYLQPVFKTVLKTDMQNYPVALWAVWATFISWVVIHTVLIKRVRMKKEIRILEDYMLSLKPENV